MENILRDCAEKLITAANSIVSVPAGQTPPSTPVSGGVINVTANSTSASSTPSPVAVSSDISTPVAPPIPAASSVQASTAYLALQEHRRIFGYRPPATTRSSRQSHVSRSSARNMITPYSKKTLQKNTFTKAFVCLSKVNQCCPPNAAERIRLSLAGLGEQKITFFKGGDSAHVHEKVLETFPSLVNGGGYEILRTSDGNSKTLIDVPCPPVGYDVNFLKSALGQAKGFLRPLQQDLTLDATELTQVLYTYYTFAIALY